MKLPSIFGLFNQNDSRSKMQKRLTGPEAQSISVSDAQSWNPETHPNGRGSSYLVDSFDYDGDKNELSVTYRDGFTAIYNGISSKEAKEFMSADSKGRWALRNLWNRPYKRG